MIIIEHSKYEDCVWSDGNSVWMRASFIPQHTGKSLRIM